MIKEEWRNFTALMSLLTVDPRGIRRIIRIRPVKCLWRLHYFKVSLVF